MWEYIKQLEYPVPNLRPNAAAAKVIMSQYGGPNGEIGASLRYLSQRYAMPDKRVAGLLVDIGTEELGHMEMVGELVKQLSRGLSTQEIIDGGMDAYFTDHTVGIYPAAANGTPFSAATIQSVGDPLADLSEDMAAEQKARVTYDNILKLVDDPDVCDVIRFLREREIVHYQRFAEALNMVREGLDARNVYAINPAYPPRPRK